MSSDGSRASIPGGVLKTIQNIKEITDKHSDEDIYAVLKECSMDPNETIQKLLYLDTFHEVKRKHDRKKENRNSRLYKDARPMSVTQGRGARGGRGNFISHHLPHDAKGVRNVASRKETRVNPSTGRGSLPVSHKSENRGTSIMTKSLAVAVNGPSNGSYIQGRDSQGFTGVNNLNRDSSVVDANKLGSAAPQFSTDGKQHRSSTPTPNSTYASRIKAEQRKPTSVSNHHAVPAAESGVYSSASDPVLVPSLNSHLPGAVGRDVVTDQAATESSTTAIVDRKHIQMTKHVPQKVDDSESTSQTAASGTAKSLDKKRPNQSKGVNEMQPSTSDHDSQLSHQPNGSSKETVFTSESARNIVEASSQSLPVNMSVLVEETTKLHLSDVQHVIFPNHFQVPEEFKSGLTFGSFDVSLGLTSKFINGVSGEKTSSHVVDSFQENDETAREPSLSNQSVSSTAQEVDYVDHPQSPEYVPENIAKPSEGDDSSSAAPKFDQSKQEGPQLPVVQNAQNFSFGFVPPVVGNQSVQFEGFNSQACMPYFAHGNSLIKSTSGPTPPATQPAATPQQVPVFRQAYTPNYLPYSQYFSPIFMPPIHQFLSHGGFPHQPSSGNVYLPPVAASTGVKYSLPQYKPGSNIGNQTHVGFPYGYGSFTSSPVPYGLSTAVTSGGSAGNDDFAASHLKENNTYTTGQQTKGSAVWIPSPGRDIPGPAANSFYNLPPNGQHVAFSPVQTGRGAFAGIYHPAQTMTAPSTVHPLLQRSQGMDGSAEMAGPPLPSGSYQHHQGAQMNWNGSY